MIIWLYNINGASLSKFPGNPPRLPPQTGPQKSIQGKVIPTSGPLSSEYPDVAASVCPARLPHPKSIWISAQGIIKKVSLIRALDASVRRNGKMVHRLKCTNKRCATEGGTTIGLIRLALDAFRIVLERHARLALEIRANLSSAGRSCSLPTAFEDVLGLLQNWFSHKSRLVI